MTNQNKREWLTLSVLSIDAWRDDGNGWTWNNWRAIGSPWLWAQDELTPRKILRRLRDADILRPTSVAKLRVEVCADDGPDGTLIEIQDRKTGEPLLALSNLHGGS